LCCVVCGCFFLVVEEESEPLVHHLPVGCLEWRVLVFGLVLGCLLVVDVSQSAVARKPTKQNRKQQKDAERDISVLKGLI
jgi:hypothetical protein